MKKEISAKQREELLHTLKTRFDKNSNRHKGLDWTKIKAKLESQAAKLWSLYQMEESDGEPDVVAYDKKTNEFIFYDCAEETPKARRSVCYDPEARDARKEHKPKHSALGMANDMGITVLNEEEYRSLQKLGKFDSKTSSWIATPNDIREKGGALFCDYRFGHVFVYHNGVESYYAGRGFRGSLRV